MKRVLLYAVNNKAGLTKDALLMAGILRQKHEVVIREPQNAEKADIAVHLEIPSTKGLKLAPVNIFVPNPEWFLWSPYILKRRFTKVFYKTRHAERVFGAYANQGVYTSFTSVDRLNPVPKQFEFLHVAGKSKLKGTDVVVRAWLAHPEWPTLHVYSAALDYREWSAPNIKYNFGFVDEEEIIAAQNRCMFAVQPSVAEGFGHVIWEALSTGAITITTAAPPMNEIPAAYYVAAKYSGMHHQGPINVPVQEDLENVIEQTLKLKPDALIDLLIKARDAWLLNDAFFRHTLETEL